MYCDILDVAKRGDLYGLDGKTYRLNAELDTSNRSRLTLYIDFQQIQQKDDQRLHLNCKRALPNAKTDGDYSVCGNSCIIKE